MIDLMHCVNWEYGVAFACLPARLNLGTRTKASLYKPIDRATCVQYSASVGQGVSRHRRISGKGHPVSVFLSTHYRCRTRGSLGMRRCWSSLAVVSEHNDWGIKSWRARDSAVGPVLQGCMANQLHHPLHHWPSFESAALRGEGPVTSFHALPFSYFPLHGESARGQLVAAAPTSVLGAGVD
jgi:hypothetical protein